MWLGLLTICLITFLSDLTPGPNFWKIVHHAISGSRRQAVIFILGLSTASTLHCVLGMLGVSALVATSESGLMLIQLFGGGYIAWYGLSMLRGRKKNKSATPALTDIEHESHAPITPTRSRNIYFDGVLTNFSNPKTILFYASLFALTLTPNQPVYYVVLVMASLLITSLLTNLLVASIFSIRQVSGLFNQWERAICRTIGGLLILGGLKIALQSRV